MKKPRLAAGVRLDTEMLARQDVPLRESSFIDNLRLAGSGNPDAKRRMQHALQMALVKDRR